MNSCRNLATAVRCGKMIFVSGQSPVTKDNTLFHPNDIVAQTREVSVRRERSLPLLVNLEAWLRDERAWLSSADIPNVADCRCHLPRFGLATASFLRKTKFIQPII